MRHKHPVRKAALGHSSKASVYVDSDDDEGSMFESDEKTSDQSHNTSNDLDEQDFRSQSASSSPSKKIPVRGGPGRKPNRKPVNDHRTPFVHKSTVFEGHKKNIYCIAFNPYISEDETPYFATVGGNKVSIYACPYDTATIKLLRQFGDPNNQEGYYAVTWAYHTEIDRHVIVVGGNKGVIRVLEPEDGHMYMNLRGHGESVNELRTNPNDSMIVASAGKDFTVRLWNIRLSQCVAIFGGVSGHRDQILSLDFDYTSNYLITGSMDHRVKMWHIGPGSGVDEKIAESNRVRHWSQLKTLEVHFPFCSTHDLHMNYVDCVRFIGDFIFSKASENCICFWKFGSVNEGIAGQGKEVKSETYASLMVQMLLPNTENWFIKFDIQPQKKYLACGSLDGIIRIWKIDKGMPNKESDYELHNRDLKACIRQIAFSPCGKIMLAVGDHARMSRYDLDEQFHEDDKLDDE